MPRKSATKKAVGQRTFRLPANVLSALDAVVEHFDEDANRVARRFLEDGIREIAIAHNIEAVLSLLGERRPSPFQFDATLPPQHTFGLPASSQPYNVSIGAAPIQYSIPPVTPPVPIDTADIVLPNSGRVPSPPTFPNPENE